MGVKAKAKAKAKEVKSQLKSGAKALVGQENASDEESLIAKQQDKSEGEAGKEVKSGNGVPKLMISEPGRQAFWFIIIILSVLSCQAGLVLSFLGGTLRPVLENHDVMLSHYGKLQATLNVGKTGSFIVIVGLMMVKGSACQLVSALLARQKRKSRRRCAVKLAFGCVIFEVVFILLVIVATSLLAFWLNAFHATYRATLPRALVDGYLRNTSVTAYVNWLQYRFQCCGVTDFKDWFISDWLPLQWLVNRYPTIPYYRDHFYTRLPPLFTKRYPDWPEMSRMSNYEKSAASRLSYLQDRSKHLVVPGRFVLERPSYLRDRSNHLVDDKLIDNYVGLTSFAEVPFSCCRPDAASTWCTRQYLVFKLYGYDFKVNSTIYQRGCAKQVETYINGRLSGVGVMLLVLLSVRLLNLLMLRLVQTSTFNALVGRRHLSPALGWLITTTAPQAAPSADYDNLLEEDLLSDMYEDEWDGIDDIDSMLEMSQDDSSTTWDDDSSATSADTQQTESDGTESGSDAAATDLSAGSPGPADTGEHVLSAAGTGADALGPANTGGETPSSPDPSTPGSEEMTEISSLPPP